jgi:cytochrome c-type biogenesis protein CcmH/NrfG
VIVFYLLSAVMVAAALALVVWPLLKVRDPMASESISQTKRGRAIAAISMVILIPLTATLLYRSFGRPHWQEELAIAQTAVAPKNMLEVEAMVNKLAQRLRDKPSDVEGWTMLGRSYIVLEKIPEAVAAYEKAFAQSDGNNIAAALGLGEALAMADERSLNLI